MKTTTTANRLKELMTACNLRQIDILNKCAPYCQKYNVRLGRNDLSQYVNGKVEPGQDKLSILGSALGVNEAWLMGYDVPKDRMTDNSIYRVSLDAFYASKDGHKLVESYLSLNELGQKNLLDHCELLLASEKYHRKWHESIGQLTMFPCEYSVPYEEDITLNAAHERTDIEVTEEMKNHDNDIMDDDNF